MGTIFPIMSRTKPAIAQEGWGEGASPLIMWCHGNSGSFWVIFLFVFFFLSRYLSDLSGWGWREEEEKAKEKEKE